MFIKTPFFVKGHFSASRSFREKKRLFHGHNGNLIQKKIKKVIKIFF